jgi:hypothetical protein
LAYRLFLSTERHLKNLFAVTGGDNEVSAEAQNAKMAQVHSITVAPSVPTFRSTMAASRDFVRRMGSPPIEHVIPGAQLVVVCYAVYRHCGIYTGGCRVIHYSGWVRGRRGLIEEIPLDEFTEGREFEVNRSPPDSFSGHDVVRRGRSRLGERCYDLLENNCEHFCSWCQLGEARSVQIELMAKPLRLAIAALQALWSVASTLPPDSSGGAMRPR